MNPSRIPRTWLGLVSGLFAVTFSPHVAAAQSATSALVQSQRGLHTVSFNTLQGTVRVLLPDDMMSGDTISGTVVLEPAGANELERTANTGVLRGTVIDLGGQKVGAGAPVFTVRVPAAAAETVLIGFDRPGLRLPVTTAVPLSNAAAAARAVARTAATPGRFDWPPTVSTGSPATITGPFDGNAANTKLSLGGAAVPVIAESPRQAVVQLSNKSAPGVSRLAVQDGPRLARGPVRVVQVSLTAPKTDLVRGEKTLLTVEVSGLQGLAHPVPMQVNTNGTVTTEGGNRQQLVIAPADPGVAAGGVFRLNRTITGTAAGGFEVVAEVVWAQPAPWLAGRIVHVEGAPGGHAGRWRVPVRFPGDTHDTPIYFGGEKKPDLRYCNWIQVGEAEVRDGVDYVKDYKRTTDPTKPVSPPPTKPLPAGKPTPPPAPPGGGDKPVTEDPPPCKEDEEIELGAAKAKFTLLDGKQELFLQTYTDKDAAATAAGDFAAYLKKVAELGGEVADDLPDGDGAGGAVFDMLLKYLEMGSTTIEATIGGKLRLAGATKFTASMNAGLRDIEATCTDLVICVRGVWVPQKRYAETETKRRETFTCVANQGDDAWEKISDSSGRIDPKKAADWANECFKAKAAEFKDAAEKRKKFQDDCK